MLTKERKIMGISAIFTTVATASSLYLSQILQLAPCELCWYQRILLFPLVFILWGAFFWDDIEIYKYVMGLSLGGVIVSAYHSYIQIAPSTQPGCTITAANCSDVTFRVLGIFSIPNLSFLAFSGIALLMGIIWYMDGDNRNFNLYPSLNQN